jgi:hypothetical protein
MADPTQFTFSLLEATEALIKQQGLHEGKWVMAIEFNVNVALMGTGPTDVKPGVMVLANGFQIQRATEPASPPSMTVDAAVVNPRQKSKKS